MESLEDAERLDLDNCTWSVVTKALQGLKVIHRGYVVHGDIAQRNILLLPNGAVVWIDFSAAEIQGDRLKLGREFLALRDLFFQQMVCSHAFPEIRLTTGLVH